MDVFPFREQIRRFQDSRTYLDYYMSVWPQYIDSYSGFSFWPSMTVVGFFGCGFLENDSSVVVALLIACYWARRNRRCSSSGLVTVRLKVLTELISETRVGRIYTEICAASCVLIGCAVSHLACADRCLRASAF